MSEFNQQKYINDYMKEKYDTIKVQVKKGEKDTIKQRATKLGYKSVNAYINDLIKKDIESHITNEKGTFKK